MKSRHKIEMLSSIHFPNCQCFIPESDFKTMSRKSDFSQEKIDDLLNFGSKKSSSTFDRNMMPPGPMSTSYENYIRNIYRPGYRIPATNQVKIATRPSTMLRMNDLLGSAALDESNDDRILTAPATTAFSELGLSDLDHSSSGLYSPYANDLPNDRYSRFSRSSDSRSAPLGTYSSGYSAASDRAWRKNNRQMIVDYKDSDSTPLTPFMYQDHPYVRPQDTRIVGSNFVQITSRPRDAFLEKVDRTLAEIRAESRY
ncbi:hypothetical protein AB6A40_007805 [Gnathostoma spinigerum]|uniref:Uncharacterized protein n=1 Tax=Gnathostoma spinigerum TaxID=75299 RepID=A0ABD6EMU6_9BILA